MHDGRVYEDCRVQLAGEYNVSNALAAAALAHHAGASMESIVGSDEYVRRRPSKNDMSWHLERRNGPSMTTPIIPLKSK